ncbi:MAG: T9SS type A sorting domain-containing protein [Chitinophagaceae bacterium]|nr:MAG: T9SS type A sorting domain-containing protein [Chitinophagaceae bacterium]
MKAVFLFLAMFSFADIHAQAFNSTGSGNHTLAPNDIDAAEETIAPPAPRVMSANLNPVEAILMEHEGSKLMFDQLPPVNSLTVHITDADGTELITRKLGAIRESVDIKKLKKGMHFVTIISENSATRKSFTLNID